MDFPANVTTNVHVVDDVNQIHWALYSRNDEIPRSFGHINYPDDRLATIEFVHEIRQQNSHVYYDLEQRQIWLFALPRSQEGTNEEQLISRGYLRTSEGILNASSLLSLISKDGRATGQQALDVANVYDKAMLAISSTLSHNLARDEDWMLLGDSTCLNLLTLDQTFGQELFDFGNNQTNAICFEARWDAASQLAISSTFPFSSRLCRLSRRLLAVDPSLEIGTPVLLCPSGMKTKYRGLLHASDENPSSSRLNELKRQCTIQLSRQGLPLSPKSDWIRVEVARKISSDDEDNQSRPALITIWPAEYAISADVKSPNYTQNLQGSKLSGINDPLARVEAWFSGRATRAKEVEAVEKELESIPQQQPSQPEASDLDDLSDVGSPIVQDVVSQDLIGIYPTPPDGLISQSMEMIANNDQLGTSPTDFGVDQGPDNYGVPGYEDGANQDLFGDMDMDMLGGNDLTDADFNFFDDPGMEIDQGLPVTPGAPAETTLRDAQDQDPRMGLAIETAPLKDEPPHESLEMDSRMAGEVKLEDVPSFSLEGNNSSKIRNSQIQKEVAASAVSEVLQEGGLEKDSVAMSPRGQNSSQKRFGLPDRGSFNSMSLSNLGFDSKYRDDGRFGYRPAISDPLNSIYRRREDEQQIPKLGVKGSSAASPNSEANSGKIPLHILTSHLLTRVIDDDTTGGRNTKSYNYDVNEDLRAMNEPVPRGRKRGLNWSVAHPATPASPDSAFEEPDQNSIHVPSPPPSAFFNPTASCEPLTCTPSLSETFNSRFENKDQAFIEVAQLVADQAASGSSHTSDFTRLPTHIDQTYEASSLYKNALAGIIARVFPSARCCNLMDFAILPDHTVDLTRHSKTICKLEGSLAGVQRMGSMTDIFCSATPFWEELSLGPSSGPKDIHAFCIFPKHDFLIGPARTFLEMMRGAYQACNLGRHTLDSTQSPYPFGLFPISTDGEGFMKDTKSVCARIGKYLADRRMFDGNSIIYMLDVWEDDASVPNLCSAFLDLFQSYQSTLEHQEGLKSPNDLVLQIVPSALVFSKDRLVLPSPGEYKQLAFQVYDRCGPASGKDQRTKPPYICAPAIRLSKPIPKAIDFKLTSNPSLALLDGEDCLHLAYKWRADQQWLTSSWVNNLGTIQWNAAYWLSKDDDIWHAFSKAVKEIWETTMEILQSRKANCRILLAKDGLFERQEVEAWRSLNTDDGATINLTLLNIDVTPPLALFPFNAFEMIPDPQELLATPVSTPFPTGQSPEVSSHISTPGGTVVQSAPTAAFRETDADARLVDITDETWSVILDRVGIDFDIAPDESKAGLRGYLVKRGGARDQDGLLPVQVDVVNGSEPLSSLLREVLGMYRNLALLARVRHITDPVRGTLPIHVAAATKAYGMLCKTMRYESA